MSENLLVKTQALQNLYECKIPRNFANSIINLFPDPNAVTIAQTEIYGEEGADLKQNIDGSTNDKINAQNNNIQRVTQLENQGQ